MRKRTVGFLFVLVLSLSLSGCGGKSGEQKPEQAGTQGTEQKEQENESDPDAEQEEISYGEQEELSVETGGSETEEFYDPNEVFQNIVSVLDEVIDKEKVYTQEEFEELVTKIFDKIDYITYDPDLGEDAQKLYAEFNLKGAAIQNYFNNLFYNIFGQFGGCSEMGIKTTGVHGDEIEIEVLYNPI